jgi:hypothetical protein
MYYRAAKVIAHMIISFLSISALIAVDVNDGILHIFSRVPVDVSRAASLSGIGT